MNRTPAIIVPRRGRIGHDTTDRRKLHTETHKTGTDDGGQRITVGTGFDCIVLHNFSVTLTECDTKIFVVYLGDIDSDDFKMEM